MYNMFQVALTLISTCTNI